VQHRGFAEREHRDVNDRPCLIEAGVLKMADYEGIVALLLGGDRVADDLPRAAEFDDRMCVGVVRGDAFYVDYGSRVRNLRQIGAQAVPVDLAVVVVDVALIPDPDGARVAPAAYTSVAFT